MAKRITELTGATSLAEGDIFALVDVSDTTQATSGTTKKSALSLIADYLKARVETLTNKTLTSPVLNSADINTPDIDGGTIDGATISGGSVDGATISGGSVASDTDVVEVLKKVYPVGSIYINASVSTNPATLLGFGTWSAFGAGRTLVGIDSADTDFDTIGETGGAKTHTLSVNEMPSHNHTFSVSDRDTSTETSDTVRSKGSTTDTRNKNTSEEGGGQAHNNLQPYIVTYLWKRLT